MPKPTLPFVVYDQMLRILSAAKDLDKSCVETATKYIKKLRRDSHKTIQNLPEFRICPAPAAKNCCKDRSRDGFLCGSVWETVKRKQGRIIEIKCFPAGHLKPINRKPKTQTTLPKAS